MDRYYEINEDVARRASRDNSPRMANEQQKE